MTKICRIEDYLKRADELLWKPLEGSSWNASEAGRLARYTSAREVVVPLSSNPFAAGVSEACRVAMIEAMAEHRHLRFYLMVPPACLETYLNFVRTHVLERDERERYAHIHMALLVEVEDAADILYNRAHRTEGD